MADSARSALLAPSREHGDSHSPTRATHRSPRWPVTVSREGHDRLRVVTALALAGLGIGALVAALDGLPVGVPDPLHLVGLVCPFCGGTRALRYAILGDLGLAWTYNPLSVVLVAGAVGLTVRHMVGAMTGRWLNVRVRWNVVTFVFLAAALVALWANQLLHAEMLIPGP